jgi:hypothetical protein
MSHAKSLRVIGQSLEVAKLQVFESKTDGPNYIVQSDSLSPATEWILRHSLSPTDVIWQSTRRSTSNRSVRFTPADISRLDDQAKKQRRTNSSPDRQTHRRLSQLLRVLGDHLDRMEVYSFQIFWTETSSSVQFHSPHGLGDSRSFTAEKLAQLGLHSRFRRSSRNERRY